MTIQYNLPNDLNYQYPKDCFVSLSKIRALRYLKLIYPDRTVFMAGFIDKIAPIKNLQALITYLVAGYDHVVPLTGIEVLKIRKAAIKRKAFEYLDTAELFSVLEKERIAIAGKEVTRKQFDAEGNALNQKTYHAVYELYKVNFAKVISRRTEKFRYAVKCWCTTTNNEHWVWVEKQYATDPLTAIASTFRVHRMLIPYIKELKRQGDVMLVETKDSLTDAMAKEIFDGSTRGDVVPLTPKQYFGLLTAES